MKRVACLAVLAAILPAAAFADCVYPKQPSRPPDGNRAARAEMVAAKKIFDKYQADITSYLSCLKGEHEAAMASNPSASEAEKKKMTERWEKKNDAAVDEAQAVADRFNEQLRICKARPDGCTK
jgi:opacity protein-like surface antigen